MTRKQFEYDPSKIETKWQKRWEDAKLFEANWDPAKPKKYVLEMFPYPSGRIHMGHVRNYSIGDVMARYFRMRGYNVLHPMGWDAFGLPAENAAIQNKVHPKKWTFENIENMKKQLSRIGLCYDWRREVTTCSEDYYRWEQLMFLKMYKDGLAYREKRTLNWCPSCATVLANEEVVDGQCWRCDSKVEARDMDQWFLKITKYADELLKDIDTLDQWPDRIRIMQRNWIGKSEGAEIDFAVKGAENEKIRVFTTRPDTIFGATSIILAPEHRLVAQLSKNSPQAKEVAAFVGRMKALSKEDRTSDTTEKEGCFTGGYALHPFTGEVIPIWIANFVVTDYGTGALMAVPAHDTRDFDFATKYKLPILKVVENPDAAGVMLATGQNHHEHEIQLKEPFTDDGVAVNSEFLDGLTTQEAKKKVVAEIEKKSLGHAKVNFRLRDWGISRQRYWGAPIPIVYCEKKCSNDGVIALEEKDLPVRLPEDVEFSGKGGSPLAQHASFLNVKCPKCGGPAKREADTMATFVESSWYYARYTSVWNTVSTSPAAIPNTSAVNPSDADKWLPIDHYIGGVEHATGHLLYVRFFQKLMRDWGWVKGDEPATQLICQGMVYKDGAKMSKSKGNVVDPDELIARLGTDTARLFVLFAGPIEKDLEWNDQGVEGCYRFLGRVYRLVMNSNEIIGGVPSQRSAKVPLAQTPEAKKLEHLLHKTIQKVTLDIQKDFHYNTAISFMMELVNALYPVDLENATEDVGKVFKLSLESLVLMLSPFAPHVADELWEALGHKTFTLQESWPAADEKLAQSDEKEIVFQINGKIKDKMLLAVNTPEDEMKKHALANAKVQEALKGVTPKRVVVVPNKLVNIVI